MTDIKSAIERAVEYLSDHPTEARYTDSMARATLGESLRVDIEGSDGDRIVTDMPSAVGGMGDEPSPGWLYRAAIASCVASTIGMEAARAGLVLDSLEVVVDSESDDRGILGMDDDVRSGPLSLRIRVQAESDSDADGLLQAVIERGAARCPVLDATRRAIEVELRIET